jgi:ATP-dependent DNA helicase DinG
MPDVELIDAAFGDGGWLADSIDGYTSRQGQMDLALAVDNALDTRTHLLAEAPTGTGKSMAYGVPAAVHALATGETVVIATANITLQEQLFKKDLPTVAKILQGKLTSLEGKPLPNLRFRLMKGMANYVCLDKLDELDQKGCEEKWFLDIDSWASKSLAGDKSELPVEYPRDIWGFVSSTSEECTRDQCKFHRECFAFKSRGAGEDDKPHVVVTNYHMLYTDMIIREATEGFASILPPYTVLIMDEAHEAADIAMSFNGFELSESRVRWLTRGLTQLGDDHAARVAHTANKCAAAFFKKLGDVSPYDILRKPLGFDCGLLVALDDVGRFIQDHTKDFDEDHCTDAAKRTVARLRTLQGSIQKRVNELHGVVYGEDKRLPEGMVYYVEKPNKGTYKLCCKSVDVQKFLRKHVFAKTTMVGTSATLATGGSFRFTAEEFGLRKGEFETLEVPSPFDPERVLLVVPRDVPEDPRDKRHTMAVGSAIHRIATDLEGRTMALFTSYRALNTVKGQLEGRLNGIRVLVQGDLPKSRIIEEFKKNPRSVILATASFWQGVDIPGETLSCVVIDKFPFMPPSDPVLKYMEEVLEDEGRSAFFDYSIPKAVIALKQGVGRLIRRETDYGVIVLCDHRLDTKGYGKQFLKAFPPGHFRGDGNLADVSGFIAEVGSG